MTQRVPRPACLKWVFGVGALRKMAHGVLEAPQSRALKKEVYFLPKEKGKPVTSAHITQW